MYFSKFPKIRYDLRNDGSPGYQILTNLFFRVVILNAIKNNVYAYFEYILKEGERLDVLAERFYGNPEYHWVLALANDMVDPLHDMPKDYDGFNSYIVNKYGSIPNAHNTVHHYEKRILRKNNVDNIENTVILEIDSNTYSSLAESSYTTYNLDGGKACEEVITRHSISCYDWEFSENEKKRHIRIIAARYIPQIIDEYNALSYTAKGLPKGYRTIA
jgi:hypothetical protein